MDRDDIKLFVRQTLGCTCPEEVFERIEYRTDVALPGGAVVDYQIDIGGRLLVFVVSMGRCDSIGRVVPDLVSAGVKKRDKEGFNRFRFVLLTGAPERLQQEAQEVFDSLGVDEKTHLHMIGEADFPIRP